MLIRLGYDIQFDLPAPVSFVAMLHVHPSRVDDLREPDLLQTEPALSLDSYIDNFGNICTRFDAPAGRLRLSNNHPYRRLRRARSGQSLRHRAPHS